jgi:hypothetical protein
MPPPALKKFSIVDFARTLTIEINIHCALDAGGEWLAIGGSSHFQFIQLRMQTNDVLAECLDC